MAKINPPQSTPWRLCRVVFWALVAVAVCWSLARLETERATVVSETIPTRAGTVTMYHASPSPSGPLIVVAHGFAGSHQMMQYISRDLARAGFSVAAFDFYGHGRSHEKMSADVTSIDGTTRQLMEQTIDVARAVQNHLGRDADMGLVGHSMATDIVIRAADRLGGVAAIAAISMYSDAITPTSPQRLLILSGAWEKRLRQVALDAVVMVAPEAVEGQTVSDGSAIRRAVSVPSTEHVAVLFSPLTHQEIRDWMKAALTGANSTDDGQDADGVGRALLIALIGLAALFWPARYIMPHRTVPVGHLSTQQFFLMIVAPTMLAIPATFIAPTALFGVAGFGSVLVFFAVWGGTSLLVLARLGRTPARVSLLGLSLLLLWGLGVFALALDRYAAAFVPSGPRVTVMMALLVGTLPFMVADRLLVYKAALWRRITARAVPIVALGLVMTWAPRDVGLLFTLLPVMALFYLVYGLMGRAVSKRVGPTTAGLGLGVILAWAIAASTPLFAG